MTELETVAPEHLEAARKRVRSARNIVVKVGSNVLVGGSSGVINRRVFCALVESIADIAHVAGRTITLVTSGAVAVGRRFVGDDGRHSHDEALSRKQALAALGQPALMHLYAEEFGFYGLRVAQMLMTRDDFSDRERFINARNTVRQLHAAGGVVPIVNENDSVANDELRFGDNDRLAALMTTAVGADLLVILSDVDALHSADPTSHPDAPIVGAVYADDPGITEISGPTTTDGYGSGGMASKVRAARVAGLYGVPTIVGPGRRAEFLGRVLSGGQVGTLFVPRDHRLTARKAWIRFSSRPAGVISIDRGAEIAIRTQGRSLLPGGVTGVSGDFGVGAAVRIQTDSGTEVARGLAAYPSGDMRRVSGKRSDDILSVLGYHNGDAVVHRDDLVLVEELDDYDPADIMDS